jgi:hypothetical protein
MDYQFWIYLVIAIIYLVSRALKKAESLPKDLPGDKPDRQVNYDPTPPMEKPKQLTFEELLREITEAKQAQKPVYQPRSEVKKEEVVVDYDDQIGEEEQDLEEVDYNKGKSRSYEIYEEAKRQAFARPSLEETMNVRDVEMKFGKFKEFSEVKKKNRLEEYLKAFQDPEGLKKAVVMSEILKRKF